MSEYDLDNAIMMVEYYNQRIRKAVKDTQGIRCILFLRLRRQYQDIINQYKKDDEK